MDSVTPANLGIARGADVPSDERDLISAAQRDPIVFGELYRRYLPRIYSYLRARSPGDQDAEDLTHEVFLRALAALPKYRQRGIPFSAWLFRIAHNAATDAHRRRKSVTRWDQVPEGRHPIDPETPETILARHEAIDRVEAILSRLSAREREIVLLRFVAELTFREIGAVVGKSESGVYKELKRALETLKEDADAG